MSVSEHSTSTDRAVSAEDASIPHLMITDAAANKVHALIQEEGEAGLKLRVYITGGGCSGFQYGFAFVKEVEDDDHGFVRAMEQSSPLTHAADPAALREETHQADTDYICVLVDMMSFQYLLGATIDYQEDVNGARFVISNPNAKTTCGCGSSFSA